MPQLRLFEMLLRGVCRRLLICTVNSPGRSASAVRRTPASLPERAGVLKRSGFPDQCPMDPQACSAMIPATLAWSSNSGRSPGALSKPSAQT